LKVKYNKILPKIIVILGPTASGKSGLAVKLAKKFGGEVISADSRQVYKGMDIGTAKPAKTETEQIRHYLIDIKNPNQNYTVAQYKKDAIIAIKKVLAKNKLPILCGGTGLYIKAVVDNLEIPEVKPNFRLRKKLETELQQKGLNFLYEKLIKLDPEATYIIDKYNPRRVIRALEITFQTKKPFSSQRKKGEKIFDVLEIGLKLPPEKLKWKIEKRVDQMIKDGLIKETTNLLKKYPANLSVFDAIGYHEIINCLQGKISLSEAIRQIKSNTWHYAKRQMTWFKKPARQQPEPQAMAGGNKDIKWIEKYSEAEKLVKNFLNK